MFNTLALIGKKLNAEKITWAVGGSIMLNHYNLIENPNDIDIIVVLDDISKVEEILNTIGTKKIREHTSIYSTQYFYEYIINGIDIDIMSGLKINHEKGSFDYIFDSLSIGDYKRLNNVNIPLASLEDWYVLYGVMPNREYKVNLIEDYILKNKKINTSLVLRNLKGNLPDKVTKRVTKTLLNIKTNIRIVKESDLNKVTKIEDMCFPKAEAATLESFKNRINTFKESFFVAELENNIIGFINGAITDSKVIYDELYEDSRLHNPKGKYQSIFGLDVMPKYQHNGIAKKLMNHMIESAKEKGCKGLILTCKENLIGFYESFGYKNNGISKSTHGDAIWYDMILEF